jgi:hypothetical protein
MISLKFQSAIDITIDNQCTNMKLTSPIYFVQDAMYPIQFPQQVNPKHIVKTNFVIGINQDIFGIALLYHLQGKENTNAQLLVIWGCRYSIFYSHAQLIQQSIPDWDKDKLKELYDVYHSQYKTYSHTEAWQLDDNTILKTECNILFGFNIKVTISEESINAMD